jgi:hypothetical protein
MRARSFAGECMRQLAYVNSRNLDARKALRRGDYAAAAVATEKMLRAAQAAHNAALNAPLELTLV